MTTESTQPPSEAGQSQATVPGQTQGHRRRRRRRKTKSNQAAQNANGAPQASQPQGIPAQNIGQPPVPQSIQMQPRPLNGQQGGQQGSGSGRKKRKKAGGGSGSQQPRFEASPGNSINGSNGNGGSGGGKKRRQQKGPRQFVGPMDHSYRVANGNVADGPPSTIPFQGNGHGAYYNDTPSFRGVTPAINEASPTKIFFFIDDLFFLAKIQEASRKLGVKVEFVKGDKDVLARITDAAEEERPALLVFDLNNVANKPLTLIPKLKAKLKKSTSIIGFLSHLQGDLKMKAVEAGCDTVMPRSAFSQSLPNLLRRYGMEEEEDNYPQPM
jgi:ActR/RegA family two-component response regulator